MRKVMLISILMALVVPQVQAELLDNYQAIYMLNTGACSIAGCSMQGNIDMGGWSIINSTWVNTTNINSTEICLEDSCIGSWLEVNVSTDTSEFLKNNTDVYFQNLGVGTSTIDFPLHIVKNKANTFLANITNINSNSANLLTMMSASEGATNIVDIQNGAFTILGNGKIGIGTKTPDYSLLINDGSFLIYDPTTGGTLAPNNITVRSNSQSVKMICAEGDIFGGNDYTTTCLNWNSDGKKLTLSNGQLSLGVWDGTGNFYNTGLGLASGGDGTWASIGSPNLGRLRITGQTEIVLDAFESRVNLTDDKFQHWRSRTSANEDMLTLTTVGTGAIDDRINILTQAPATGQALRDATRISTIMNCGTNNYGCLAFDTSRTGTLYESMRIDAYQNVLMQKNLTILGNLSVGGNMRYDNRLGRMFIDSISPQIDMTGIAPTTVMTDDINGGSFSFGMGGGFFKIQDEENGERILSASGETVSYTGYISWNPNNYNINFRYDSANREKAFFINSVNDYILMNVTKATVLGDDNITGNFTAKEGYIEQNVYYDVTVNSSKTATEGSLSNLNDCYDNDYMNITETTGTNAIDTNFTFSNVDSFRNFVFCHEYTGTHDLHVQVFNPTLGASGEFVEIRDVGATDALNCNYWSSGGNTDIIDNGDVILNIIHLQSGNTNHKELINCLRLER